MLNIVLYEPEIPENTGNISRNCVGFNARLHMIKPYGFILNEKTVKRAGLDYWKYLDLKEYNSWNDFENLNNINDKSKIFFSSKRGNINSFNLNLKMENKDEEIYIVFGKESAGITKKILSKYKNKVFFIPMNENVRSFNLSNCVAILSYEFHRQNEFKYLGIENIKYVKQI